MPPNMEKFYDPQFDLGDEEDKESFQCNSKIGALWNLLEGINLIELIMKVFISMTKRKK